MVSPTDMWSRSADLSEPPKQDSTCTCLMPRVMSELTKLKIDPTGQVQIERIS